MSFPTPTRLAAATAVALAAACAHPAAAVPTSAGDPSKACGAVGAYPTEATADDITGDAGGQCYTVAKSLKVAAAPASTVVTLKDARFQHSLTISAMPADTSLLLENVWIDTTAEWALTVAVSVPVTIRRCDIRFIPAQASGSYVFGVFSRVPVAFTFQETVMFVSSTVAHVYGVTATGGTISSSGPWPGLELTVRSSTKIIYAVSGATRVAGVQIDAESSSLVYGVYYPQSLVNSFVNVTSDRSNAYGVRADSVFVADSRIRAVTNTGVANGIAGTPRLQRTLIEARGALPSAGVYLGTGKYFEAAGVTVRMPLTDGKCRPVSTPISSTDVKLAVSDFKCGELDSAGEPKGEATPMTGSEVAATLTDVSAVTPRCPFGYVVPFDAAATDSKPMPAATTMSLDPKLPPAPFADLDKLCTAPFTMDPAVVPPKSGKATALTVVGLPAGKTEVAGLTAATLTVGGGVREGAELVLGTCTLGGADKAADALVVAGAVGGAVRLGSGTTVTGRTVVDAVSASGVLELADGATMESTSPVIHVKESFGGKLLIGKSVTAAMAKYPAAGGAGPPFVLKNPAAPCTVQYNATASGADLFGEAAAAVQAACAVSTLADPIKPADSSEKPADSGSKPAGPGSPARHVGAAGSGGSSVHPAAWAVPVAVLLLGVLAAAVAWCVFRRRRQQPPQPAVKEESPGGTAEAAAEAEPSVQFVVPALPPPASHEPVAGEQAAVPEVVEKTGEGLAASGTVAVPVSAAAEDTQP